MYLYIYVVIYRREIRLKKNYNFPSPGIGLNNQRKTVKISSIHIPTPTIPSKATAGGLHARIGNADVITSGNAATDTKI